MANKTRFPAKAIAADITNLMKADAKYGKNIWYACNHTLKQWNLPSLQQMDTRHRSMLNKALGYALEA